MRHSAATLAPWWNRYIMHDPSSCKPTSAPAAERWTPTVQSAHCWGFLFPNRPSPSHGTSLLSRSTRQILHLTPKHLVLQLPVKVRPTVDNSPNKPRGKPVFPDAMTDGRLWGFREEPHISFQHSFMACRFHDRISTPRKYPWWRLLSLAHEPSLPSICQGWLW